MELENMESAGVAAARRAAELHRPGNHLAPVRIAILGDRAHLAESVYGKIFHWLGAVPVAPAEADETTRLGLVWKPWIHGGRHALEPAIAALARRLPNLRFINRTHFDDDKAGLQRAFAECFGYPLEIDPLRHVGPAVAKSRENARHDGRIVACPLAAIEPDRVYQRVVDNECPGQLVEDLRFSVVHYSPVLCYVKYRPVASRFSNTNLHARLAGCFDVCGPAEFVGIEAFLRRIGLEVGEIDVLRDRRSGRLFVVDANNTPFGPPNHIAPPDGDLAIRWLADAFVRAYLLPRKPGLDPGPAAPEPPPREMKA